MSLDHFRSIGKSGLHVSALGLGTMTFGAPNNSGADEATSVAILDRFHEDGGNFIDTSNVYCKGESERIVGRWLAAGSHRRDRMVLGTKFSAGANAGDPNSGGASRKAIIAACEASLRRLKTDYIDLYWMHWQDPITPIEETMRALDQLARDGKIRYAGLSDVPSWVVAHAHGITVLKDWNPIVAIQIEYSLIERSVEFDYIEMAKTLGLGVTPWSPQAGGALTGKYKRDGTVHDGSVRKKAVGRRLGEREFSIIDQVEIVAHRLECSVGQVALAWLCAQKAVTAPIMGARTLSQLEQNISALNIVLDADTFEILDSASKPHASFPHNILKRVWGISHGGMTINDHYYPPSAATPKGVASLG